jgi:predicted ester cyclase
MGARDVFERYSQAIDRNDMKTAAELVHDEFRLEGAGLDGIGKKEFVAAMKAQLDAFPDYSENATCLREEGDVVHFTAHVTGTQKGVLAFPGMKPVQPTGRKIRLPPEPAWVRVKDGRLLVYHVEAVAGGGVGGILVQLGVSAG